METYDSPRLDALETVLGSVLQRLDEIKKMIDKRPVVERYDKFVSVPEAAEVLCCHPDRIYAMIKSGRLGAVKEGRRWKVSTRSLNRVYR
jgi:excisionase family DNA binding protein